MNTSELIEQAYYLLDKAQVDYGRGEAETASKWLRELNEKLYEHLGRVANKDDHAAEKAETPEETVTEEKPGPEEVAS